MNSDTSDGLNQQGNADIKDHPSEASSSSLLTGAALITAGFFANTVQGALGKQILDAIAPGQFLWLLITLALLILLPLTIWRSPEDIQAAWNRQTMTFYLLRAVFGLLGFYLFVWAAGLGSLVSATVLLNTTPVFIPIIGALFLDKQISKKLWGAIALGFIGLLLVVQPSHELLQDPANLLGLGAGLSAAIEFLTVRQLSRTQTPLVQTLYYLLVGFVLMAPIAIWQWQPLTSSTTAATICATVSFLLFQLLLVKAYQYAEPHQIGVFQYSSVIFAAGIGWLFFKEIPNMLMLIGILLITCGGALSIYLENLSKLENTDSSNKSKDLLV
ncbi:MAG: DMT family transporter [Cyanobacteria bacterium J06621_11]